MKLHQTFRILDAIYIFLLSIGVGCIMTASFSAATIFREPFVPELLSVSDSGLIMGQIFIKCNNYFNILAIAIIIYELVNAIFIRRLNYIKQRWFLLLLGGVNVILIFLFTLYYTPYIIDAQMLDNIGTSAFDSMHKQSEMVFKVLLFTLSIAALWRGIITDHTKTIN